MAVTEPTAPTPVVRDGVEFWTYFANVDGVDTWTEQPRSAAPSMVAAGWLPSEPRPAVEDEPGDLPLGKPAPPDEYPAAPPSASDVAFAAEQAALAEDGAPDPDPADEPSGSDASAPQVHEES